MILTRYIAYDEQGFELTGVLAEKQSMRCFGRTNRKVLAGGAKLMVVSLGRRGYVPTTAPCLGTMHLKAVR